MSEEEQEGEPAINPEKLEEIEEKADDPEEAETLRAQAMLEEQKKKQEQREAGEGEGVDPALGDTQMYEEDDINPEELLEDVPEEKREKWIDSLVFDGEVVEECEMAGGNLTATFKVRSGSDSLDIAEVPKDVQGGDPQATIQYVNTKMSIRRLALVTQAVNGNRIGSTPDEREEWLEDRPSPFLNRMLEEYNDLEMKLSAVLRAGDIKNS